MALEEEKENQTRNFIEELKKTLLARREKKEEEKTLKKEEKKDNSAFGEKPFISRTEAKRWFLRNKNEFWQKYRLGEKEVKKLDEELFPPEKYGSYIEKQKREPERALKELEKKKWKAGTKKWMIEKKTEILKKFAGK